MRYRLTRTETSRTTAFSRMDQLESKILRFGIYEKYVPIVGRFFLVATFFEDGLRMFWDWSLQVDYLADKVTSTGAVIFLLLSAVMQLGGGTLVVMNHYLDKAAYVLLANIVLQALVYGVFSDAVLVLRNVALAGSLLLLISEARLDQGKKAFLSAPITTPSQSVQYLLLTGRVMLALLLVAHMPTQLTDLTPLNVVLMLFCGVLLVMLISGFRTRTSALLLVVCVCIANLVWNNFWVLDPSHPERDLFQYYFFQTISILGGLLLLVSVGPGDLSVDERKKFY